MNALTSKLATVPEWSYAGFRKWFHTCIVPCLWGKLPVWSHGTLRLALRLPFDLSLGDYRD